MFIWMQISIEFYLKHYEILQPLLRYCAVTVNICSVVLKLKDLKVEHWGLML